MKGKSNHILSTTLFLLVAVNVFAAEQKGRSNAPKLIIGITVDQLRTDYLLTLEDQLSEGGLKMLLDKGLVYEQVTYDIDNPDATAAMAVLATGTYAFHNGIPSREVYNAKTLK